MPDIKEENLYPAFFLFIKIPLKGLEIIGH